MPRDLDRRLGSVLAGYNRLVKSLPDPLDKKAASLAKTLAPDYRNLVEYYGAKEAFPLLRLPLWLEDKYVSDGLMSTRKGYGVKTASAALYGYLYIRIQDNVLDEPDMFDPAFLLVGNEFIREFFYILHGLFPPGSPFWGYCTEYWRGTSSNTLWERQECGGRLRGFCTEDLARVGGKLDGVKVTVASICILAGKEEDIPRFCAAVDNLNIGSQLHNDVVSFVKDLRHDYFTTVIVNTLGGGETGGEPEDLFCKASIAALTGNHLESWLAKAIEYNEKALKLLGPDGLPGLDLYVESKNAHLAGLGRDLVQLKKELLSL